MVRRAFLRMVSAAAVAAFVGVESFKIQPRADLDELNRLVADKIMPGIMDMFFTESPLIAYLKKGAIA